MKLRTILRDSRLVVDDTFIDHQNIEWYQAEDVAHDAMASHAYQIELSRMREAAETTPRTHERQLVLNLLDALDRRADELMREWGFES